MIDVILNEQQILSYVINHPQDLYKIADNYFLSNFGKAVYEALHLLQAEGMSFSDRHILKESHRICGEITLSSISKLMEVDYDEGKFDYYYKRLKMDYSKDRIQSKILQETTSAVSQKGDLDLVAVQELRDELQRGIDLASDDALILLSGKQMATQYRETINARKSGDYKFSTGDSHLDKYLITGASPGDMTTIFAATGMAKSAFAMNLVNKQINKVIPSLWISLELGTIATLDRLIAHRKKFPMSWLYPANIDDVNETAFDKAEECLKELEEQKFFAFIEEPSLNMDKLETEVKLAKKKMGTDYLVVTIDLATMIPELSGTPTEIEDGMNRMHGIAKREKVHFILIVQANRGADAANIRNLEQLDRLRPKNLKDIKNAAAIAERCRLVFSIFRPKHYAEKLFPEFDEVNLMDDELIITILKQNQGEVGKQVKYLFQGETFSCFPLKKLKAKPGTRTRSGS